LPQYDAACVDTFRVAGEAVAAFLSSCWDEVCNDPNSFPYSATVALPDEKKALDLKSKTWTQFTRPRTYSHGSLTGNLSVFGVTHWKANVEEHCLEEVDS